MDAAELNRRLNRAARFANLAAVTVANGGSPISKALTEKLVAVLAEITAVQKSLVQRHPDLEYHFDPQRPPSAFMREVQRLGLEAQTAIAKGDRNLAILRINEALALEPPPLAYEILEKRRNEISGSA